MVSGSNGRLATWTDQVCRQVVAGDSAELIT
jgi:hypothetical protein